MGAFTRWHLQYPDIYDYIVPENVFTDVGIAVLSSDVYHLIDRKDPSRDIRTEAKSHVEDDVFKNIGLWSRVSVSYNLENGQEIHAFVKVYKDTASARRYYPEKDDSSPYKGIQLETPNTYQEIFDIGNRAMLYGGYNYGGFCRYNHCLYFDDKNIEITFASDIDTDDLIAFVKLYHQAIPLQ